MQIDTLKIDKDFFKEEVRCNYTVSSKMKKVWAVELDMLKKIEEICDKYEITYYADSGTLIGVVRHNGFIPWDDDIDIVMKRDDYNKFLDVAEKELKYPYFLQTAYTDKGYCRAHAQLRNSSTTGFILDDEKREFWNNLDDKTKQLKTIVAAKKKYDDKSFVMSIVLANR